MCVVILVLFDIVWDLKEIVNISQTFPTSKYKSSWVVEILLIPKKYNKNIRTILPFGYIADRIMSMVYFIFLEKRYKMTVRLIISLNPSEMFQFTHLMCMYIFHDEI